MFHEGGIIPYNREKTTEKTRDIKFHQATLENPSDGYTFQEDWLDIPVVFGKRPVKMLRFENEKLKTRALEEAGGWQVGHVVTAKHKAGGPIEITMRIKDQRIEDSWESGLLLHQAQYYDTVPGTSQKRPGLILLSPGKI